MEVYFQADQKSSPGDTMASYLWTVKDLSGQTILKKVEVSSAREAQDVLPAQGYTDLIFQDWSGLCLPKIFSPVG